jgi:ABC-2 type transport system permease protein
MRRYVAVFRCRVAALLQYRSAVIASVLTQIFWGMIKMMILVALYSQTTAPQPISLAQAIVFIWIGQATITLLPWSVDEETEEAVKSGTVVYALTQPLDLYWRFFSRSMAGQLIPTLMRALILLPIAWIFFGLSSPVSWGAGIAFASSLLLSVFLSSAITTMVVITLFWTVSGEGIQRILPHLSLILSGMVVPLPLFPDWMQPILSAQPLRGIIDIPCRIYTGLIPLSDVPYSLAFQLFWSAACVVIGRWLIERAQRRIEIQGG